MASILVVDDEPDIRFLEQMALESDGHVVMTAADGDDALAAVEVEVPDLVLLDVMMPAVDGWTVLDRLKSHLDESIKTVRVVMVTSLSADMEKVRAGVGGAVDYLVKPVDTDDLLETVRRVLAGEPEPEQRLQAQHGALTALARIEKGVDPGSADTEPRPKITNLERISSPSSPDGDDGTALVATGLTETQRAVLKAVTDTDSVIAAASALGVSRANVYASLRRSARTLGISSAPVVIEMLRSGVLVVADD